MISMPSFSLKDCTVIVTGAGRGNGLAIAQGMKDAQASVIGIDRVFQDHVCDIEFTGDVTDQMMREQVRAHIETNKPQKLVLVNNAGITRPNEDAYPEADWRDTLETNLTAPFLWIEEFRPLFRALGNGSIINITSLGAERAFPNNPAYIASKSGLRMLGLYYAKELGQFGVRVNNIGPGYMTTDMTAKSYAQEDIRASRAEHTLLKRWGKPQDLVGAAVFLASSYADYITGQDLYVDGGWMANGLVGA